ncbi:MAG: hypothetical protein AAF208_11785 [Cyanobacteria bacterium P01_A01_bin.45]
MVAIREDRETEHNIATIRFPQINVENDIFSLPTMILGYLVSIRWLGKVNS